MPNYPTDNLKNSAGQAVVATTLTVNNITDYRENKQQLAKVSTVVNGTCTTSVAHRLKINDAVKFTVTQGSITAETLYYVNTVPTTTTFTVAATKGGVTVGGAIGTSYYYTIDGILTGAELTGYTETINDFVDVLNDTMPLATSFAGNSVLSKLGKEIALFYDKMYPSRLALTVSLVDATDQVVATTAHGYSAGDAIYFTTTTGTGDAGDVVVLTPYYVIPFSGAATLADNKIALTGHGFSDDDVVYITTGVDGLPAGKYYIKAKAADNFELSATDSSGVNTSIDITADGTVKFMHEKKFLISATLNGNAYNINVGGGGTTANKSYLVADYLTADDLKYLANLKSLKFNDLQAQIMTVLYQLKKLTAEVANLNAKGALSSGKYPSGKIY